MAESLADVGGLLIRRSRAAEEAMLSIAAGEVDETWTAAWLKERVRFIKRS